jgi:molecular chaperone DnaJ
MNNLEDLFAAFSGGMRGANSRRGRDIQITVRLSFLEAVNGCSKDIDIIYFDRSAGPGPDGQGERKSKTVSVQVPAGVDTGVDLRVQGKGAPAPSNVASPKGSQPPRPGDLILSIEVEEDAYFERNGSDIHVQVPVSITQV